MKKLSLILLIALLGMACQQSDDGVVATAEISAYSFSSSSNVAQILFDGIVDSQWSAQILDEQDFVSFKLSQTLLETSGIVSSSQIQNIIYVYIDQNTGDQKREASIVLELEGSGAITFSIEQSGTSSGGSGDQGDVQLSDYGWAELPTQIDNDNYLYVTHFTTLDNGSSVRNFSMCYDKQNYAARWVAFPFHSIYDGNVGRNEDWQYDPKIDQEYQPNLYGSYSGSYDRGHQLASADRQATVQMNQQTFYYSNMTPKLSSLNQDVWADFESLVRNQVCSDTLYVVTGADYSQTIGSTYDKNNKECPLPRGYYKVLLRTRSGNSGKAIADCSASELKAIGFWFDHTSYSSMPSAVSVATIEAMTGFDFFPMVDDDVKTSFNSTLWHF